MKMIDALESIAPKTLNMFACYLMESFGMSLKEFQNKPLNRIFYEVSRYFGYPLVDGSHLLESQAIQFIKKCFSDYEDILSKYNGYPPDPLAQMSNMSNKEKNNHLQTFFKREVNLSLCHAIVDKLVITKNTSLCDSLVDRVKSEIEITTEEIIKNESFWKETIKKKEDEIAPF